MSKVEMMLKAMIVEGAMPRFSELSNMLLSAQGVSFIMDPKISSGKLVDEIMDFEPLLALTQRMRECLDVIENSSARNSEKGFMDAKEVHMSMKALADLHYLGIKLSRTLSNQFEDFANKLREESKDPDPTGHSMDDILKDFFPGMN